MHTNTGSTHAGAAGLARPATTSRALPGSLAADLAAGTRPAALLLPGIDATWPVALADLLLGRPELAAWLDAVVTELDAWAAQPAVRSLGSLGDGFAGVVAPAADGTARTEAAMAPYALAGAALTDLVAVMTLEAEGLDVAGRPETVVAGHSAGLLAAPLVAGPRDEAGLIPVTAAVRMAQLAALMGVQASRHSWAVTETAVAAAAAGDEDAQTPMVVVAGPRSARLRELVDTLVADGDVAVAVTNSATRHVLAGRPAALAELRLRLTARAEADRKRRSAGRSGGTPLTFTWEPLASSAPFHHPALTGAAQAVVAQAAELGIELPHERTAAVLDPATVAALPAGPQGTEALVHSVLARHHDWAGTLVAAVPDGAVGIVASPLGALGGVSASALRGRGALVVDATTSAGRGSLFAPGRAPAQPASWAGLAPRVVRSADGSTRLVNRHTALTGRSPMVLPGMTPTTAEAPIVAAAANGGHLAELAGGGQVSERIFTERVAELTELLAPGQEVVLNAMYLDPYLWGLHVGTDRLVQKARAAGAPIAGVTISAGIPDKAEALALLEELHASGLWLNAFKPGTAAQVAEVLSIASEWPHPLWLHLEGGAAGGHHSWEDLDELLLATYHRIREHGNVVLAVGGGIGDPERAGALLDGTWALAHGEPVMPVDAVLLGTVAMATLESATSPAVKAALAAVPGHEGWVGRGQVAGGTTSGRSGLDADIHFVENPAAVAARLLDEVAGDAEAVAARHDEIVAALAATAKPWFGDVAAMTYVQLLGRFVELTAVGRGGRYEDGAWLDPTHRSRFVALLQRAEARLDERDQGPVPTLFADPASVDDPAAAVAALVAAHPLAATAMVHPADVDHFLTVCRAAGKPVPFVPVIDADVRRWYQSDSLWQAHSDLYEADQVLIIPGPAAVAGITTVDEPVAGLLDRFEAQVAGTLGEPVAVEADFRLALSAEAQAPLGDALVAAALAAPTWSWLGSARTNPLHRVADPADWQRGEGAASWADGSGESATIVADGSDVLTVTLTWPDLGLVGDGAVTFTVTPAYRAGTVTFEVGEQAAGQAGAALLAMFAAGGRSDAAGSAAELAASHAATVGAGQPLPDRVMSALWPHVFSALADAGLAAAVLDLVHLRHEVTPSGAEPSSAGPVVVESPEVARTDGGLVLTVASAAPGATVTDRFFVRRAAVDEALPAAQAPEGLQDVVTTPVRTLGSLTVRAPERLETFATVSGDPNPIHRSDSLARFLGLPGRIVHGMWTSAAATRAVVETAAEGDASRLRSWTVDFLAPVLPGEQVTFTVTRSGVRDGSVVASVEAATENGTVAVGTAVVAPARTLYVFPGQGIQAQGMGMEAYESSPAAREIWERADELTRTRLGFSILHVVRDNPTSIAAGANTYRHPNGVLHLTQFTQVAMATLAAAQVAQMREAGVFDPDAAVAGHSVGEYNALAASSSVLPLEAVVELVFARGMGMHGLVPRDSEGRSDYGLAVIRPHLAGLSHAQAEQLVADVAASTGQLCEIVNHNLRGKQYAVAGTVAALAELAGRLGSPDPKRPALVHVPGIDVPFHSSALLGGVDDFRWHLLDKLPPRIDANALIGRYIPNLHPVAFSLERQYVADVQAVCGSSVLAEVLDDWDNRAADPDGLARTLLIELLAWQFASPVRWIETFELATAPQAEGGLGIGRLIEVGVGTAPTLANLAKGSLALPSHRGLRPWVANVEVDADVVMAQDTDPVVVAAEPEAEAPSPAATAPEAAAPPVAAPTAPAGAPAGEVADLPVDHKVALAGLLALRVGVRPAQLGEDTIEALVDGASSRRNQVLMDLGKEFAVPAIDGAHEVPLSELATALAGRSAAYRYPGPVLSAAVEAALTAALGPKGSSPAAVAKRVGKHWGLGSGWAARTALALALGTRDGVSRRGGELADLAGSSADELIDAAVAAVAAAAGVPTPSREVAAAGGTVDAAAVNELRDELVGVLADQAGDLLTRLGRVDEPAEAADLSPQLAALAQLEAEHGPASLVARRFDARRHVMLASGTAWARADIDHLVQSALLAEAGRPTLDDTGLDDTGLVALAERIAVHRDDDERIGQTLRFHRTRLVPAGRPATVELIDRALSAAPRGVTVPGLAELRLAGEAATAVTEALTLTTEPGAFAGQVALVTGASPRSIAWATLAHLLRGGATVVVATTTDTPERIDAYRDLERQHAGPGAQLHVVPANLASFADIDALLDWMTTPTTEEVGPVTREVKPALWPTLVLPFAAAPSGGELPDSGPEAELTLRLLLLGLQRLVGGLADRAAAAHRDPFAVVLPMSPNHGTFGGDGSYGDAKAALEAMLHRWRSERSRWGRMTRLVSAEIGWVRGTGLMAGNDRIAEHVEAKLGVTTFSSEQMGALIAALSRPAFTDRAAQAPVRVDLSGGLAGRTDLAEALADVDLSAPAPADDEAATVDALPNLPVELAHVAEPVAEPAVQTTARIAAEDMIVLVGIAEQGPWGGSATRWQAETGGLDASGITELAWRTGLVEWDASRAVWTDAESGEEVAESQVAQRYGEQVLAGAGLRPLTEQGLIDPDGVVELKEVFLDRPLTLDVPGEGPVTLPAGAAVRVPRSRKLSRSVGGQFPQGSDPTRLGLERSAAGSMDPLAAWNLVVTAEALADAGVTAEELVGSVHPGLVGNTQGSGMGGMTSIQSLYMAPIMGRAHANDVLQEALGNVVSAHVNQGLVGGYGPMVHPVAACATAAVSLEEAVDKIALGKADIVVGGGWDDLSPEGINGFADMAATADSDALVESGLAPHQHSRPGDRRRRGFVEAQGGGSFVVTRGSVALALGLPVRAVVGYASSFGDGIHTSIPAPGLGALGAARGGTDSPLARALADLGLTADDIGVVSKHDTSTQANDPNEAFVHASIQKALGRTPGAPLRVISQKSLTGHAKGGAAAWQMSGLCDVFATGVVPGNRNLVSVDPAVTPDDLVVDHQALRRAEPVRAGLVTSLGFGHVSAVVLLAHPDVFTAAIPAEQREAYQQRAHGRRVSGTRQRLAAQHGGDPVLARRTERRLGAGSPAELKAREAAMLLAADGTLPGTAVA